MNVPHHGGTPAEMLRDLADFLDKLDNLGEKLVIRAPGNKYDGHSLDSILNPGEDKRTMQSDVRWLADQLENDESVIDRLKGALIATGVRPNIVEAIIEGGDPDGGLVPS